MEGWRHKFQTTNPRAVSPPVTAAEKRPTAYVPCAPIVSFTSKNFYPHRPHLMPSNYKDSKIIIRVFANFSEKKLEGCPKNCSSPPPGRGALSVSERWVADREPGPRPQARQSLKDMRQTPE